MTAMSRGRDFQIGWVVFFAIIFWMGIWQHDIVARVWHSTSSAAIGVTSSLLGRPLHPVEPPATPNRSKPDKSKRSPGRDPLKQP